MRRAALLVLIWAAVAVPPASALAYRQTKTCLTPEERDPDAPTQLPSCAIGQVGWPVRWEQREIPFQVYRGGSETILPSVEGQINPQVLTVIRAAMRQWNEEGCSDFEFKYEGLTDVSRHDPEDGVNVITWVEDGWASSSETIALTSTTMTVRGVLVDADMEFNVSAHRFTISDPPGSGAMDLANTTTHEAGHMLGLDEAPNREATMYWNAPNEEIQKRDLHPDDVAGLCAIYPIGVPAPRYGDGDGDGHSDGHGVEENGCCSSVGGAPRDNDGAPLALSAGCLLAFGARRRRRRRRQPWR